MKGVCNLCCPWNLPLTQHAKRSAEGAVIPMTYQEWLWYYFHVAMHQADNWAGEIEGYTKKLLDNPQESIA